MQNELAYFQMQSTKPQTLGYGLNDSPAGLAAWIVEKFRAWCDCGGDVERKFTKDELLNNVMIYWVTQTITSSTRIYFENRVAAEPAAECRSPRRLRDISRRTSSCRPSAGCRRSTTGALDRDAARRAFRRDGGAGAAGRGRSNVLPASQAILTSEAPGIAYLG